MNDLRVLHLFFLQAAGSRVLISSSLLSLLFLDAYTSFLFFRSYNVFQLWERVDGLSWICCPVTTSHEIAKDLI